jgi:hypothetical protein
MLLCNKLALRLFHIRSRSVAEVQNIIPKTPEWKRPFDQRRELSARRQSWRARGWCVIHPIYLPRFRRVVGKLKIAPRGAVPVGRCEVVLIDRL